jgi:acetate kinase
MNGKRSIFRVCVFVCSLLCLATLSLHAQATSTICSFSSGMAAGTTHDYAPLAGLPVGTACQDDAGSTGKIVAKPGGGGAAGGAAGGSGTSTICSFNSGPAAGTTHDYAPLAGLPIGTACQDDVGSTGHIIAKPGA